MDIDQIIGRSLFIGEKVEFGALDSEKDAEVISSWTKNMEFSKRFMEGTVRPYPVFEVKKKLKERLKKADDKRNSYIFAVRKKGGTELVCVLTIGWILPTHQVGRIFMDFGNQELLSQFGEEVLRMALRYAFMELSLYKISIEVPSINEAEIAIYEKAGFALEVIRREAAFSDGHYCDSNLYSLFKPDWKASQALEGKK